ncbi:hypothetical protein [Frigoribacterium sp. PvP032]|uniref:hypothetical protein n=1 Tax=Frigoribacterium sp. PvP032 TaxID=2806589 RepID=UPI001AE85043|nr:hypothetical protein [Frigoribacterium sp. PvP032]MBP1190474.1 hypothetical protein [Frigoribacterium sp. PvP032]
MTERGSTTAEPIRVELTDDEREVLLQGLGQWGGPADLSDPMAVAMGFASRADFSVAARRLSALLGRPRRRSVLRAAARLHPDARTVGATVSPDNAASLAFVESYGFFENGGQWDDEDCREMIFETSAWAMATFFVAVCCRSDPGRDEFRCLNARGRCSAWRC